MLCRRFVSILSIPLVVWTCPVILADASFIRGDVNGDFTGDSTDMVAIAGAISGQSSWFDCIAAYDVNDDGIIAYADVTYLGNYRFMGGPPPAAPFPACGYSPDEFYPCDSHPCDDFPRSTEIGPELGSFAIGTAVNPLDKGIPPHSQACECEIVILDSNTDEDPVGAGDRLDGRPNPHFNSFPGYDSNEDGINPHRPNLSGGGSQAHHAWRYKADGPATEATVVRGGTDCGTSDTKKGDPRAGNREYFIGLLCKEPDGSSCEPPNGCIGTVEARAYYEAKVEVITDTREGCWFGTHTTEGIASASTTFTVESDGESSKVFDKSLLIQNGSRVLTEIESWGVSGNIDAAQAASLGVNFGGSRTITRDERRDANLLIARGTSSATMPVTLTLESQSRAFANAKGATMVVAHSGTESYYIVFQATAPCAEDDWKAYIWGTDSNEKEEARDAVEAWFAARGKEVAWNDQ